jgi:hypothetical protein
VDGSSDILDLVLAQILEVESEPVTDRIARRAANIDPAGRGDTFQACRYVYAVAEDIVTLTKYVTKVNAHP